MRDYRMVLRTYFGAFLLAATVTVLVLGVSLTYIFERNLQTLIFSQSVGILDESRKQREALSESSRALCRQIYLSLDVQSLADLKHIDRQTEVSILESLRALRHGTSRLQSINLYLSGSSKVFTVSDRQFSSVTPLEEFSDPSFRQFLARHRAVPNFTPVLRPASSSFVYSSVLYNYMPVGEMQFLIMLNYDTSVLTEEAGATDVYAVDRDGVVQVPGVGFGPREVVRDREPVARVLASSKQSGYFVYRGMHDARYLASYLRSSDGQWTFVSHQPYREITRLPRNLRRVVFAIVTVGVLLLAVVARFPQRRLLAYTRSRQEVLDQLRRSTSRLKRIARKKVLRDLLEGRSVALPDKDAQFPTEVEWQLTDEKRLALVMARRYAPDAPHANYWMHVEQAVAKALREYAQVLESVSYREDVMLFLVVPVSGTGSFLEPAAESRLEDVRRTFDCGLGVTGTVSHIFELHTLSADVGALLHMLFFDNRSTLMRSVDHSPRPDYAYPESDEKQMIDAILHVQAEKAKTLVRSIIWGTADYDHGVLKMVTFKLIHEMKKALGAVELAEPTLEKRDLSLEHLAMESEVDRITNVEALLGRFCTAIDRSCAVIRESRRGKRDWLVTQVDTVIEERLHDVNLQLGEVAEQLGFHPHYLSRVYKQSTGVSLPRRILTRRLEEIKQRLLTTDEPIKSIVRSSGLPDNAYFFKVFRDFTGMTPRQYRDTGENARSTGSTSN